MNSQTHKKRKSFHGFLADPNKPVSMPEITDMIRKDRRESDENADKEFPALPAGWKKSRLHKPTKMSFVEFVKKIENRIKE